MATIKDLLVILVSSSLISNVVLSQFLGLCPFLGVSKKVNTAAGMGAAIIFVITLSSVVTGCIYKTFHLHSRSSCKTRSNTWKIQRCSGN